MDKQRILVVDDELLIAVFLEETLLDAGYDVTIATGGEGALRAIAAQRCDAIITDIRMPGMNGWDLANRARLDNEHLPVIYVSGDSASDWVSRGVSGSVMIAKPFEGKTLVDALADLLSRVSVDSFPMHKRHAEGLAAQA
ncbi:hypothetical protein VW35_11095 [Devosia soli]|uniref:Response regulatory domain-containing protein n=1 Tax=Devosia soli TaxID=361041 RepID=A0A0F5L7J4_9HYPH|nr:response regulator [Devosia soli]KKB78205.1 hypothetical protein VW35_11095 [Devosia soli]